MNKVRGLSLNSGDTIKEGMERDICVLNIELNIKQSLNNPQVPTYPENLLLFITNFSHEKFGTWDLTAYGIQAGTKREMHTTIFIRGHQRKQLVFSKASWNFHFSGIIEGRFICLFSFKCQVHFFI